MHRFLHLTALAVAATFVAACSPAQKEELRVRFNLLDPVVVTDAAVAGQTVALDNGQALIVRVEEKFSPDYKWNLRLVNDGILNAPVRRDFTSAYAPGLVADQAMLSAPVPTTSSPAGTTPATTYALASSAAVAGAIAPPAPDMPGEVTFRMRGINPGSTPVVLEYHRVGEAIPQKTVAFNVVVR